MEVEKDEVVLFETIVHCGPNGQEEEDSDTENETSPLTTKTKNDIPSPAESMLLDDESSSSESEDDDKPEDETTYNALWSTHGPRTVQPKSFRFIKPDITRLPKSTHEFSDKKPYDFFCMFVDDELLQEMVDATNSFAKSCLENNLTPNTWIQPWHETNIEEMRKFLGMIMWMGLVQYPTLNSYWCRDRLYTNAITAELSRSKFQLLSYMWRFSSGDEKNLDQIEPLFSNLKRKFRELLVPQEVFAVDKTFIPFDMLARSKGVNLLTLNLKGGYIYDFSAHLGKEFHTVKSHHTMNLIDAVLNKGRILCANEDWTSLKLAEQLLAKKTHLVAPIQRPIPTRIRSKKLRPKDSYSEITRTGVCIQKYIRPRELYLLTTRRATNLKYYRKLRSATEISEQLKTTNGIISNNFNWYQKLAIELLVSACLVNACYLYRKVCSKKISSTRFKEEIIKNLMNIVPDTKRAAELANQQDQEHRLVKRAKKNRCAACYERVAAESGRKNAANRGAKGFYECNVCTKYYCVECFFKLHTSGRRNNN